MKPIQMILINVGVLTVGLFLGAYLHGVSMKHHLSKEENKFQDMIGKCYRNEDQLTISKVVDIRKGLKTNKRIAKYNTVSSSYRFFDTEEGKERYLETDANGTYGGSDLFQTVYPKEVDCVHYEFGIRIKEALKDINEAVH